MTVSTVPYALQNASHPAALFREAMSFPYTSGGVGGSAEMVVTQQGTPNMSVILGAGRVMIPGSSVSPPSGQTFWTSQGLYYALNDGPLTLTIAASNPTNPRIDAVYIQAQDSFYTGATNTAIAGVVTGTPAASPTAPAIPVNSILVAYIAVAANTTTIVTANITQQTTVAAVLGIAAANAAVAAVGSKLVVPTSVSAGTGTAAISPLGAVSFTSASSVAVNGVFSALYQHYLVILLVTSRSAQGQISVKMRAGGTDTVTSLYSAERVASSTTTVAASNVVASGSVWNGMATANADQQVMRADFLYPFAAFDTFMEAKVTDIINATPAIGKVDYSGIYLATTSFDGIDVISTAGNMTGQAWFWGYNEG